MSAQPPKPSAPLTDSPWFWLCVFGCAALVGLTVISAKWARRGQRLEFQRQGREHAFRERVDGGTQAQTSTGPQGNGAMEDEPVEPNLPPPAAPAVWPVALVIGIALLIGGVVVFVRRAKGQRDAMAE